MDIRNISNCSRGLLAVGALATLAVTAIALVVIFKPPFLSKLFSRKVAIITGSVAGATSLALWIPFGCSLRKQAVRQELGGVPTPPPLPTPIPPQPLPPQPPLRDRIARAQTMLAGKAAVKEALARQAIYTVYDNIFDELWSNAIERATKARIQSQRIAQRQQPNEPPVIAEQQQPQVADSEENRRQRIERAAAHAMIQSQRLAERQQPNEPPATEPPQDREEARRQRIERAAAQAARLQRLNQEVPATASAAADPLPQLAVLKERAWPGHERTVASLDNLEELIAIHQGFVQELKEHGVTIQQLSPQYEGNPNTLKAQVRAFQLALDTVVTTMFARARTETERMLICTFQKREISRYNQALEAIITTHRLAKRAPELVQPLAIPEIDFKKEFLTAFDTFLRVIAVAPIAPLTVPENASAEVRARAAAVKTQPQLLAELRGYYYAFPFRNQALDSLFITFNSLEGLFAPQTALQTLTDLANNLPCPEAWQSLDPHLKRVFTNCLITLLERAAIEPLFVNHADFEVEVAHVQIAQKLGISFLDLFNLCRAWDVYSAERATIQEKTTAVETIARLTPEASPIGERPLYRPIIDRKVDQFVTFLAEGEQQIVRRFFVWNHETRSCADRMNHANAQLGPRVGLDLPEIIIETHGQEVDVDALAAEALQREAANLAATLALIQQLQNQ